MEEVKINLNVNEVNVVLQALAELPYRISAGLIEKVHNQVGPQVKEKPAAAKAGEVKQ